MLSRYLVFNCLRYKELCLSVRVAESVASKDVPAGLVYVDHLVQAVFLAVLYVCGEVLTVLANIAFVVLFASFIVSFGRFLFIILTNLSFGKY